MGPCASPSRRLLALWLPRLPTDRLRRASPDAVAPAFGKPAFGKEVRALALAARDGGALRLTAVDEGAEALGLAPGLPLADARARVPGLAIAPADPAADAAALVALARWCERYTPLVALDGSDGLMLDVTGAAHLLGSEAALARDALARLARAGFAARAALAGTPAAAWALARFGADAVIVVAPGGERAALDKLPPAALRLPPSAVETLGRLGLRRIADLHALPRAGLAARFGDAVSGRLDRALGRVAEPIDPLRPAAAWRSSMAFAEPICSFEDIARVLRRLLDELGATLAAAELGARRLDFVLYRVDGRVAEAAIRTAAPARDAKRLAALFEDALARLDPGLGVEAASLEARVVEPLLPAQLALGPRARAAAESFGPPDAVDLAPLVERLAGRLGPDAIARLEPRARHAPERAQAVVAALPPPRPSPAARGRGTEVQPSGSLPRAAGEGGVGAWTLAPERPLRLLAPPEPIEATAPVPDDPPLLFRWRGHLHRVRRADGPERLAPEWWEVFARAAARGAPYAQTRDYYRVEDEDGARFWLFRAGIWRTQAPPPRWFLHGTFG